MGYQSDYRGRITTDAKNRQPVENIVKDLDSEYLNELTRIGLDPNIPAIVIDIDPIEPETWYDWREDIENLCTRLADNGITANGVIDRRGLDSTDLDVERIRIHDNHCRIMQGHIAFPDGSTWD